jgi:predicted nucleic acid-binding protein
VVLTYLDSSVALAHLFREPKAPAASFWLETKVSSRLLEYEIWNRLHAHDRAHSHGKMARDLLAGIELLDLSSRILSRALQAFPVPVRTLDGLHLATIEFLRSFGEEIEIASYDRRLIAAAAALTIPVAKL